MDEPDDNAPTSQVSQPQASKPKTGKYKGRLRQADVHKLFVQLVEVFRKVPGNISHAATSLGIHRATARRGWFQGWPNWGVKPIKEIIHEEQALARAAMHNAEQTAHARIAAAALEAAEKLQAAENAAQARLGEADVLYAEKLAQAEQDARKRLTDLLDKAKLDAAETMAHEANISRSARGTSIALLAVASHIFQAQNIPAIAKLFTTALTGGSLKPREAAMLLRALSRFGFDVNQTAKLALDIERERLGQPIAHVQVDVKNMSLVDALKEIDDAHALAQLLREEQALDAEHPPAPAKATNGTAVH